MKQDQQVGMPFVELILVNAVMSLVEAKVVGFGAIHPELCFNRRYLIIRNQFDHHYQDQLSLEQAKINDKSNFSTDFVNQLIAFTAPDQHSRSLTTAPDSPPRLFHPEALSPCLSESDLRKLGMMDDSFSDIGKELFRSRVSRTLFFGLQDSLQVLSPIYNSSSQYQQDHRARNNSFNKLTSISSLFPAHSFELPYQVAIFNFKIISPEQSQRSQFVKRRIEER